MKQGKGVSGTRLTLDCHHYSPTLGKRLKDESIVSLEARSMNGCGDTCTSQAIVGTLKGTNERAASHNRT
jgi:hypothetical protein